MCFAAEHIPSEYAPVSDIMKRTPRPGPQGVPSSNVKSNRLIDGEAVRFGKVKKVNEDVEVSVTVRHAAASASDAFSGFRVPGSSANSAPATTATIRPRTTR
jgi:hypothetical protein